MKLILMLLFCVIVLVPLQAEAAEDNSETEIQKAGTEIPYGLPTDNIAQKDCLSESFVARLEQDNKEHALALRGDAVAASFIRQIIYRRQNFAFEMNFRSKRSLEENSVRQNGRRMVLKYPLKLGVHGTETTLNFYC